MVFMADKTRTYSSTLRADQARQTRRRIVDAAAELFAEYGYAGTTIDAVATAAGVSRKTVFDSVGGKAQLMKLAYDFAIVGDDEPVPLVDRPEIRAMLAETDHAKRLAMYASRGGIDRRRSPARRAEGGAATSDPEAVKLYVAMVEQRRQVARSCQMFAYLKRYDPTSILRLRQTRCGSTTIRRRTTNWSGNVLVRRRFQAWLNRLFRSASSSALRAWPNSTSARAVVLSQPDLQRTSSFKIGRCHPNGKAGGIRSRRLGSTVRS
jgi:AcrR family transcriptional regulator